MKQANVRLPEELKKRVMMKCLEEGVSMNKVIVEFLEAWTDSVEFTPPQSSHPVKRPDLVELPVIDGWQPQRLQLDDDTPQVDSHTSLDWLEKL